jgi:geranylgeranyl transferase type-2 subunit beta
MNPPRAFLVMFLNFAVTVPAVAEPPLAPSPATVLSGVRAFFAKTARDDGSFRPGLDPKYPGMSDSAASDLAPTAYAVILHRTFGWPLPDEAKTPTFLLDRQKTDGSFVNVAGTMDSKSASALVYNTTQGLVALHALGTKPKHDPLPVFLEVMKDDYKALPPYSTSFFPLAFAAAGQPFPAEEDRKLRKLMVQDDDGYTNNHIAATFHLAHYYRLLGAETPKADAIVKRTLAEQKDDGSWMRNPPARDRHATFDAVFVLHQLGGKGTPPAGNTFHEDCRQAIERAAKWSLSCRNDDGGFGHFPGSASDADAVYFHVGTLVMAGYLQPVDPLPADPHLLGWGHLMPLPKR